MIEEIFAELRDKMDKAVHVAEEDFATVRTGRANPAMFHAVKVDYYGTPTPLQQLASFQNPEARTLIITPYDRSAMKDIENAIRDTPNLGVNPSNDGNVIRVNSSAARRRTPASPCAACAVAPRTTSTI